MEPDARVDRSCGGRRKMRARKKGPGYSSRPHVTDGLLRLILDLGGAAFGLPAHGHRRLADVGPGGLRQLPVHRHRVGAGGIGGIKVSTRAAVSYLLAALRDGEVDRHRLAGWRAIDVEVHD